MTTRHIAQLCCKALGVYALIFALATLQYMIPLYFSGSYRAPWLYMIGTSLPSILLVALAAFLWLKADALSSLMVPDQGVPNVTSRLSAVEIKKIAYSVLGLFILSDAIPQLTGVFFLLAPEDPSPQTGRFLWEKIVEVLVKAAIGFGLFLRGMKL